MPGSLRAALWVMPRKAADGEPEDEGGRPLSKKAGHAV